MSANFRKIMEEAPRPFEVMALDAKGAKPPIGRKTISKAEASRRVEPLLAMVASGDIPMDNQLAQALKTYVEHTRGTFER